MRCPRGSVGAILRRGGDVLVLYRKKIPKGLAGVAGHIDEGELPQDALKRELFEEAGVTAKAMKLVFHEVIENNPCYAGSDSHEWWVYEVSKWDGEPRHRERDQHEFVRFMTLAEIREYAERNDIESAWVRIFTSAGIL
ncbi:MAG: NUDIX hydrolase [Candidatus Kaiserbacteria bacterium]|nr:MAG: NUDIX hydrolase [Candidatus Kaiserbacteria bacterium]